MLSRASGRTKGAHLPHPPASPRAGPGEGQGRRDLPGRPRLHARDQTGRRRRTTRGHASSKAGRAEHRGIYHVRHMWIITPAEQRRATSAPHSSPSGIRKRQSRSTGPRPRRAASASMIGTVEPSRRRVSLGGVRCDHRWTSSAVLPITPSAPGCRTAADPRPVRIGSATFRATTGWLTDVRRGRPAARRPGHLRAWRLRRGSQRRRCSTPSTGGSH